MKRKIGLLAGAVLLTGAMGVAMAQPEGPPPGPPLGPPLGPPHGDDMVGGPREGFAMHHDRWMMDRLIVPAEDRKLTVPEVKQIAQAFLLWNGNRTWAVTDLVENNDNTISFALQAPHGDVIARFEIDRKSGHIARLS